MIKKIAIALSLLVFSVCAYAQEAVVYVPEVVKEIFRPKHEISVSSGYVYKSDRHYQSIYGDGIHNMVTVDAAVFPYKYLGVGLQAAYWHSEARNYGCEPTKLADEEKDDLSTENHPLTIHRIRKTNFKMHQVPVLVHLKAHLGENFQPYIAVGGGVIFTKERANQRESSRVSPALSLEVGAAYHFLPQTKAILSLQWINSHKKLNGYKRNSDLGGKSIRFGLGASF